MVLADWLKSENKTCEDLARMVGCDTSTISRLIPKPGKKNVRVPSIDLAKRIARATNGAVTANDYLVDASAHDENPAHP